MKESRSIEQLLPTTQTKSTKLTMDKKEKKRTNKELIKHKSPKKTLKTETRRENLKGETILTQKNYSSYKMQATK